MHYSNTALSLNSTANILGQGWKSNIVEHSGPRQAEHMGKPILLFLSSWLPALGRDMSPDEAKLFNKGAKLPAQSSYNAHCKACAAVVIMIAAAATQASTGQSHAVC